MTQNAWALLEYYDRRLQSLSHPFAPATTMQKRVAVTGPSTPLFPRPAVNDHHSLQYWQTRVNHDSSNHLTVYNRTSCCLARKSLVAECHVLPEWDTKQLPVTLSRTLSHISTPYLEKKLDNYDHLLWSSQNVKDHMRQSQMKIYYVRNIDTTWLIVSWNSMIAF